MSVLNAHTYVAMICAELLAGLLFKKLFKGSKLYVTLDFGEQNWSGQHASRGLESG